MKELAPPVLPQIPSFQWPAIWGPPPILTTAPPAMPPTMTYRPPITASIRTLTPALSSERHHAAASPISRATSSTCDAAMSPINWSALTTTTTNDAVTSPVHWAESVSEDEEALSWTSDFTTPPASPSSPLSSTSPQMTMAEIDALLEDVVARTPGAASHGFLGVPPAASRSNLIVTRDWSPSPVSAFHPLQTSLVTARVLPQPPMYTTSITAIIQRTITPSSELPTLQDTADVDDGVLIID